MKPVNVSVNRFFKIAWRLLLAFLFSLLLYGEIGHPLLLFFCFVSAGLLVSPESLNIRRYSNIYLPLIGIVSLFSASQLFIIRDVAHLTNILANVVSCLLVISLHFRDRPTSYWIAILGTTLLAIGSLLMKGDIVNYLLLFGYLGSLLFVLNAGNLFLMARFSEEKRQPMGFSYFTQFVSFVPIGIISGALIFFAFPRVKNLGANFGLKANTVRTGYKGEISLSGGGPIDESMVIAMIVDGKDKDWLERNGPLLLMRGETLGTFDGKKWLPSYANRKDYVGEETRVNNKHNGKPKEVTVYREPNGTTPIFYPESLVFLKNTSKKTGLITQDGKGSLFRKKVAFDRFSYDVVFAEIDSPLFLDQPLSSYRYEGSGTVSDEPFVLRPDEVSEYLHMPEYLKAGSYFETWMNSTGIDPTTLKPYEVSQSLVTYFKDNFTPSLDNDFKSDDNVKEFLQNRKGHCEYFSTITALYYRSLGIPSRVVVGYKGGIFNDISETLEIRERSAHAWVEYYIDGSGWFQIDPTPTSGLIVGNSLSAFRAYLSAAKFWFNRYVVDYNQDTQYDLASSTFYKLKSARKTGFKKLIKENWRYIVGGFLVVSLIYFVLRRFNPSRVSQKSVPEFYKIFDARLNAIGITRIPSEPHRKFHLRLAELLANPQTANEFGKAIEREYFSGSKLGADEKSMLVEKAKSYHPEKLNAG